MTDFSATRPFTYVAGATIDPNENNPNENTLYNKFNASINATTGHTHSGSTGDGPLLAASSLNLAGTYPWTGTHTWTVASAWNISSTETSVVAASNAASIVIRNTNTTVNNYQSLDFKNDTGAVVGRIAYQNVTHTAGAEDSRVYITTITAGVMSAPIGINSSGVHLSTNGKLNFNGSFTSGVYATSISSNTLDFYTNSVLSLRVTPTYVQMGPGCDAILDSTKKLFFDELVVVEAVSLSL